jgi:hypothetical protein
MARPKGVKETKPRKKTPGSPAVKWVAENIDIPGAVPQSTATKTLLKWAKADKKNREWVMKRWVEQLVAPEEAKVDEVVEDAPLMHLIDSLLAGFKKG